MKLIRLCFLMMAAGCGGPGGSNRPNTVMDLVGLSHEECPLSPEQFVDTWKKECKCAIEKYRDSHAIVSWEATAVNERCETGEFYDFEALGGQLTIDVFPSGYKYCVPKIKAGARYRIDGQIMSLWNSRISDYEVTIYKAKVTQVASEKQVATN